MDHSYNNNNKWRLHAIFSDPRVWIKGGSTMDQHGSTWINHLQPAPSACRRRPDSWLMRHASWLTCHVSWLTCYESRMSPFSVPRFRRQTHGSCVRLMAHASCVMRPTHVACVMRHASCVMRQASGVMRQTPRPIQHHSAAAVVGHDDNKAAEISPCNALKFAPVELYGMG